MVAVFQSSPSLSIVAPVTVAAVLFSFGIVMPNSAIAIVYGFDFPSTLASTLVMFAYSPKAIFSALSVALFQVSPSLLIFVSVTLAVALFSLGIVRSAFSILRALLARSYWILFALNWRISETVTSTPTFSLL